MPLPPLTGTFNFRYEHEDGRILGEWRDGRLRRLFLLPESTPLPQIESMADSGPVLLSTLRKYFSGAEERFEEIALDMSTGTAFQQEVWQAAREVSWGVTETYGGLAARMGLAPGAARAVGHALGCNPLHLIVPCHRFLSASGALVNYAGGLRWKQTLLRIEGSRLF